MAVFAHSDSIQGSLVRAKKHFVLHDAGFVMANSHTEVVVLTDSVKGGSIVGEAQSFDFGVVALVGSQLSFSSNVVNIYISLGIRDSDVLAIL